jgi:hypothetical protein
VQDLVREVVGEHDAARRHGDRLQAAVERPVQPSLRLDAVHRGPVAVVFEAQHRRHVAEALDGAHAGQRGELVQRLRRRGLDESPRSARSLAELHVDHEVDRPFW